jgi:hypothetical protein
MPDEPGKRPFVPSRSYDIQMRIRDKDYSMDLSRVRIVNSLNRPFQTIILDLFIDPRDIILDYIYGQDPIKLSVRYIGESQPQVPKEQLDYTLVHFKSGFTLPMQRTIAGSDRQSDQPDRTNISILTVPEKELFSLSFLVNKIYYASTIEEIMRDLVKESYATLEIDQEDLNTEQLDQVIIPPISLNKAITYLDNTFGFYKGTMGWNFSGDKLHIYNLTRRMNKATAFTIYQLVSGDDNSDTIEKCNDGKNFYTYELMRTDYSANTRFIYESKRVKFIVKPRDNLYGTINLDLEEVCKDYGLMSKRGVQIFHNPVVDRTKYHIDHTGYDADDTFAIARTTPLIRNLSTLKFSLERNLRILNLTDVGQPANLNVRVSENINVSGKYIISSSDLVFVRDGEWQAVATVRLMRTNPTL